MSVISALGGDGHEEEKAPVERRKLQLLPRGATSGSEIVSSPVSQTPSEPAAPAASETKMTEEEAKRKIKNMLDEFYGIKDKNVSLASPCNGCL
jgi:hypothetical protein